MTSSLRRKRPTTARNTSRAKGLKAVAAALAVGFAGFSFSPVRADDAKSSRWSSPTSPTPQIVINPFPEDAPSAFRDQGGDVPTPHVPAGGPQQVSNNLRWKAKQASANPTQSVSDITTPTPVAPVKPEIVRVSATDSQPSSAKDETTTLPVLRQPGNFENKSQSASKLETVSSSDVKLEPVAKPDRTSERGNLLRIAKSQPMLKAEPTTKIEPSVKAEVAAPAATVANEPTLARSQEPRSVLKASPPAAPVTVDRNANRGSYVARTAATEALPPKSPRMARSVRLPAPPDETLPLDLQPNLVIPDDAAINGMKLPAPPAERTTRTREVYQPAPMDTLPLPGERREQTEKCPPGSPCQDTFADCKTAADVVKKHTIDKIGLDIGVKGVAGEDYPCNCPVPTDLFQPRNWSCTTYTWKASGVCYKPLYFEEPGLERYGHNHGHCIQPFVSAAYFFGSLVILPYKMGLETPCECIYPLGYYRPGDCAPMMCPAVPLSCRAGLCEAGAVTGVAFIVP